MWLNWIPVHPDSNYWAYDRTLPMCLRLKPQLRKYIDWYFQVLFSQLFFCAWRPRQHRQGIEISSLIESFCLHNLIFLAHLLHLFLCAGCSRCRSCSGIWSTRDPPEDNAGGKSAQLQAVLLMSKTLFHWLQYWFISSRMVAWKMVHDSIRKRQLCWNSKRLKSSGIYMGNIAESHSGELTVNLEWLKWTRRFRAKWRTGRAAEGVSSN